MTEAQAEYTTQDEVDEVLAMLGKGYDQFVKDEAPRDYYCQIPNMVDDYGLSPQAYRLYGHLRRVAGENGKCWQNTRTLSSACGMSDGSVSNAKKELIETEFIPFIRISKVPTKTGFSYDEITITDLWRLNHDVYSKETVHILNGSEYERLVHNVKQRIFNIKNKENPASFPKNKKDAVDFEIDFHLKPKAIKDAFAKYFKLTPNWDAKYNRQFLEWMVESQVMPEQVEQAANLWRMDRRFNWAAPTLKGIQEHWLELTESEQEEEKYHVL